MQHEAVSDVLTYQSLLAESTAHNQYQLQRELVNVNKTNTMDQRVSHRTDKHLTAPNNNRNFMKCLTSAEVT